jgi:tRNA-dihydrouridine synthase
LNLMTIRIKNTRSFENELEFKVKSYSQEIPFVGLAPMEGVTDLSTRLWLSLCSSPAWMTTPFLRATATFPSKTLARRYAPEINLLKSHVPYVLIPQVMAASTDDFKRAADLLLPDTPWVDFNCGCPAPKVVGHGAGSSILSDPHKFRDSILDLANHCGDGRLSVKIRTGFADDTLFDELIASLKDIPLHHLTIHGRTREQKYSGNSRWDLIARAAKTLPFAVIGSGDIVTSEQITAVRQAYSDVSAVMIGRGALINPWIFAEYRDGSFKLAPCPQLLAEMLRIFAILEHAERHQIEELIEVAETNYFLMPLNPELSDWKNLRLQLDVSIAQKNQNAFMLDRQTLGRVKMIWCYLRQGLPAPYQGRALLRSSSLSQFFDQLLDIPPLELGLIDPVCPRP